MLPYVLLALYTVLMVPAYRFHQYTLDVARDVASRQQELGAARRVRTWQNWMTPL